MSFENPFDVFPISDDVGCSEQSGHTVLLLVNPGTEVSGQYYLNILLCQQLLTAIHDLFGDITFQAA